MLGLGLGVNRGGFVPSSILPDDLANLAAWYKADAGITTVSSAVSVWADQSGNGRDVTQGVAANRPAYGSETLNGIDVLTFDGSDWLNAASVSTFNFLHQGDSTVFMVAKAGTTANPDATYTYMSSSAGSPTVGYFLSYDDRVSATRNDAILFAITIGISGQFAITTLDNNKVTPNTWRRVGVATDVDAAAGDRMDGYVDGVGYNGTNTSTEAISLADATYPLNIGRRPDAFAYFIGAFAEIIMYSRKLSVSEIGQVDNYLKAKWAL